MSPARQRIADDPDGPIVAFFRVSVKEIFKDCDAVTQSPVNGTWGEALFGKKNELRAQESA